MDHQFLSFPTLLAFLSFIFIIRKIWRSNRSALNLPPGPWKLPLIGSIHHLIDSTPHRRLRDLTKKYGPIMHLQLGEVPAVIISSPETAKLIMKTHDLTFADRPFFLAAAIVTYNCQDIGVARYGDQWRQLKKICTLELLTVKRVQTFRSIREEEVSKAIESIASSVGSLVNIGKIVSYLTYGIISRAAFGKLYEGEDVFVSALRELTVEGSGFNLHDIYPSIKLLPLITGVKSRIERLHKRIDVILEGVVNEHKARRAAGIKPKEVEDLVDILLNFQENRDLRFSLSNESIKGVIMDMFTAGTETSSTTVEWAMAELMKNPRVLEKAQKEVRQVLGPEGGVSEEGLQNLNYLKLVIKETLRLHTPLPLLLPRECRENCIIEGYDIPAKTKVMINVWAIGRDPNYWIDAEKFIPERFLDSAIDYKGNNYEYLPFGAGRRICPGIYLGMVNVEFPLAMLLYHFDWKLPNGLTPETIDMTECVGTSVRKKEDLCLIPSPYFHRL